MTPLLVTAVLVLVAALLIGVTASTAPAPAGQSPA